MSLDTPPMATTFELLACETMQRAVEVARVADKPTSREVRSILETVYYASLAREEGRLLRLRVGFIAPEGPGRPTEPSWGWWVLPFATPVPFEKYSLVKLAPSVDARQSVIAVTSIDGRLFIWGLINNGTSSIDLREGRTTRSTTTGPDFVDVEALTPGVLDVRIGSWTRRFADGGIDVSPVHPFRTNGPLADIVEAGRSAARVTPGLWSRTLRLLLGEMQRAKHGGTLFLHSGGERDWNDRGLQLKHRVRGEGLVLTDACYVASSREASHDEDLGRMTMADAEPSEALTGTDATRLVVEATRDVHAEWLDAVRWVASLAAIDGALLLSRTFAVRAFGVIVESVSRVEVTHASGKAQAWQPFPWERFGTRHQSAAAFCASHRGSVAFVVSQDGTISVFRYREGRVVMWRPCELLDLGGAMGEDDACLSPIAD